MTTSRSPRAKLMAQAVAIAGYLKRAEQGVFVPEFGSPDTQLAFRKKDAMKVGIVMDDKVITIEIPWVYIRDHTFEGIATYIVDYMSGDRGMTQMVRVRSMTVWVIEARLNLKRPWKRISEIGTEWPPHKDETKAKRAAAKMARGRYVGAL